MTKPKEFSHIDAANQPTMVDVTNKDSTQRVAVAKTSIRFPNEMKAAIQAGEIQSAKGPVFATAIIAGTMGAKRTSELIPFCHPLFLTSCKIAVEWIGDLEVELWCTVKTTGQTGVEMEALTGCSIAALTVYDMCKALSHDIVIGSTQLMQKSGGKSGYTRSASRSSP